MRDHLLTIGLYQAISFTNVLQLLIVLFHIQVAMILKVLIFLGFASLLHCAYSAAQYRSYLRAEYHSSNLANVNPLPPIDTVLQTLLSFIITLYCVTQIGAAGFKEIRATAQFESKGMDFIANRPSFHTFCHRGQTWLRRI